VTLGGAAEDYRVALLRHRLVERWFAEGANESEIIADAEVGRAQSDCSSDGITDGSENRSSSKFRSG
jgi:hypothetical protein